MWIPVRSISRLTFLFYRYNWNTKVWHNHWQEVGSWGCAYAEFTRRRPRSVAEWSLRSVLHTAMATRSYSCRETVTSVPIYLLLLVMATPTKGKINGSNTSNYSATASDLGLPKGLTVLVRGEQNTVEVGWEPATDVIGNTSFILLLTSQVNGEKIAYREVGGGGMEGRVTLSGIQLGEAYSLTVYSTDGRLNSSEALTFTIQPGERQSLYQSYTLIIYV